MKKLCQEYDIYVVTEYKDNCVLKTKKVATVFIPFGSAGREGVPRQLGDLIIQPTSAPPSWQDRP